MSSEELVERKNGNFSKKKKFSDTNQTQIRKYCTFIKGTKTFADAAGNEVAPPPKIVYEFDSDCAVNDKLVAWIKGQCVDDDGNSLIEVRIKGGDDE